MADVKAEVKSGLGALLDGLDDGDIDAGDARKVVIDLLDALIPSGPFEGVERALLTTAVNGVASLVKRAKVGRDPDRLRRRATRLREKADRLEKKANGEG
jgi:hypothetical protein